jgi:hypothetical protein
MIKLTIDYFYEINVLGLVSLKVLEDLVYSKKRLNDERAESDLKR